MAVALALWKFFTGSLIGRALGAALVCSLALSATYAKGRYDGRASYKAKIERQIHEAVKSGEHGRADALRKLDADGVPDGWFRD